MNTAEKELHLPVFRGQLAQQQKQAGAYTPVGIFNLSNYRRCPKCLSKHVKRNGKEKKYNKQRYLCNKCRKSFVIDYRSVDIEKLFSEMYDICFEDVPCMLSTKYRKVRALQENREVQKLFNEIVAETTSDKGFPDDERDQYAFRAACELADKLDWEEIEEFQDSWHYFLNYYDNDVTYILGHQNIILVRQHDFKLSKLQNLKKPLLHCSKCGSASLSTHGFNNNARRRIRCRNCKKVSVIRVKNLITEDEFLSFLHAYLQERTDDKDLIEELTRNLKHDYYKISISRHFESLLSEQKIITHQLKEDIFNAFIAVEYLRTLPKDILNILLINIEYGKLYDSFRPMPLIPNEKNFASMSQMFCKSFTELETVADIKDVEFNHLFYQEAAAISSSGFHDWRSRADTVYEELKNELPALREL